MNFSNQVLIMNVDLRMNENIRTKITIPRAVVVSINKSHDNTILNDTQAKPNSTIDHIYFLWRRLFTQYI